MREWRKFRKLSQVAAAERVDVDYTTLGRIERGELPYNQDFLERLAVAYGCEVTDLLEWNPLKPQPPRLVFERVKAAHPDLQKQIISVVEAMLKAS